MSGLARGKEARGESGIKMMTLLVANVPTAYSGEKYMYIIKTRKEEGKKSSASTFHLGVGDLDGA